MSSILREDADRYPELSSPLAMLYVFPDQLRRVIGSLGGHCAETHPGKARFRVCPSNGFIPIAVLPPYALRNVTVF